MPWAPASAVAAVAPDAVAYAATSIDPPLFTVRFADVPWALWLTPIALAEANAGVVVAAPAAGPPSTLIALACAATLIAPSLVKVTVAGPTGVAVKVPVADCVVSPKLVVPAAVLWIVPVPWNTVL